MFETLFSPIKINKTEIKNRIVYPSMGVWYSMDGKLNNRYVNYYVERAKGGAGIVTVGPVGIGEMGLGLAGPSINSDEAIPSFAELAKAIQNYGAKAWIQLFHGGAYVKPIQIMNQQPIAPTSIFSVFSGSQTKEMTLEDIKNVQEAFVRCAERAKQAGFDGVEIIASAGYLICQFLSPLRNQRTDEYGGSFENRIRFVREIIEQMRQRLGPDYPITIRIAGNDYVPGSNTDIETQEFAKVYEKAGVDAISVTGGWHESHVPQLTMEVPRGGFAYLAQIIKNTVSIPVIASNRIPEPAMAERLLRDGCADMVNLGRVLLADPYWPAKAEAGRPEQIIPCVACLQGCMDELFQLRPVKCMVNPRSGFEGERKINKSSVPKKVMVIGAGPAGLEAACRAAEAGHQVELYEKADHIGGQLRIAGTPPHKQELWELIRYYREMLKVHGVKVFLNTEVHLEMIKNNQPDYVIAAEGAEIIVPPIEGIDGDNVFSAWEVLKNNPQLGRKVAIIGGGSVGLETAHFIAEKGTISPETLYFLFKHDAQTPERLRELLFKGNKEVTVFELMPKAGKDVGKSTKWELLQSLDKLGVNIITSAKVLTIKDNTLTFEKDGAIQTARFDNIIYATGSKSVRTLADQLATTRIPFSVIGDSVRPAKIMDAIHEAY
ncbi:MAG: FAD-dependent oxidoreductase, partial [Syntrophomonadaceae bacterium]